MTTTTADPFVDPNRLTNGEVHSSFDQRSGLQARVDALAPSVGAPKQNNLHPGYDPDLFLEALKQRHDALAMITDRLEKRHAEQEERQHELDKREKQVAFREKRIAAHERLSNKIKLEAMVMKPLTFVAITSVSAVAPLLLSWAVRGKPPYAGPNLRRTAAVQADVPRKVRTTTMPARRCSSRRCRRIADTATGAGITITRRS